MITDGDTPGQVASLDDTKTGTQYRVNFRDCCVDGWFIGTFTGLRYSTDEPDELEAVVFNTGEIGPGSWEIIELNKQ